MGSQQERTVQIGPTEIVVHVQIRELHPLRDGRAIVVRERRLNEAGACGPVGAFRMVRASRRRRTARQ